MINDQELVKKLAILDARDKQLRQQMTKQTDISKAQAYRGTCEDMCPERERCSRIGFQVSIFERDQNNQVDEYLMVKEYRRAGADQEEPLPHDLRTLKALRRTMDYLACNIIDDSRSTQNELALEWYDFLWDRLRAIRKDITQQNMCDLASANLVEQCTRFHIHSCYAMNRVKDFDVDMNKRNLNDCLQMLRQMYTDLRNTGRSCPEEFEFQKYDILLHLNDDHLSTNVTMKTSDYRTHKDMKFVVQVINAHANNDFYKFFNLMEQADYMTSCILSLYVSKIRANSIRIITAGCVSKQTAWYPVETLMKILKFDDLEDLKSFANSLAIEIKEKDQKLFMLLTKDLISTLRQSSTNLVPIKSHKLVESKMCGQTVGQIIYGPYNVPIEEEIELKTSQPLPNLSSFEEESVDMEDEYQSDDQPQDVEIPDETPVEFVPQVMTNNFKPVEVRTPHQTPDFFVPCLQTLNQQMSTPQISNHQTPSFQTLNQQTSNYQPTNHQTSNKQTSNNQTSIHQISNQPITNNPVLVESKTAFRQDPPILEKERVQEPAAEVVVIEPAIKKPGKRVSFAEPPAPIQVEPQEVEVMDEQTAKRIEACYSMPVGRCKKRRRVIEPVSHIHPLVDDPDAVNSPQTKHSKGMVDVINNIKDQIEYEKDANLNLREILRMLS